MHCNSFGQCGNSLDLEFPKFLSIKHFHVEYFLCSPVAHCTGAMCIS